MKKDNRTKILNTGAHLDRSQDKARTHQIALERIATALFDVGDAALSDFERSLMNNSLRSLLRIIESRILTEMAQRRDAPKELAKLFRQGDAASHDHGEGYAYPILEKAGLLGATGLIEAIKHRMQSHRLTLALLRLRRETHSASPMEETQSSIIQSMLVAPEPDSIDRLKGFIDAENDRLDSFQCPLIRPADLPRALVKRLCWWIAAALRRLAITHSRSDPGTFDECFERATTTVIDQLSGQSSPRDEADGVIDILTAAGRFSPELLMRLLGQCEVSLFEAGFARITGLRKSLVSRLLYESGGESLAVACKAAGFDSATFETIYGFTRNGRLASDAARNGTREIIAFFDSVDRDAAEAVLERWRRDGDFLYAIKLLDQV